MQFHPTGMMWPPSVRGILVTEGVRGEGGVLANSEGRRFMFDAIPELYKDQVAADAEEGWRYVTGDRDARRPPELLTRDHVARMILAEVKAGRGSPHGGAFLDIAWIKDRVPGGAAHIKRKLPSMYHQFKQLADLDITEEPMEVGPTTHYAMGGVMVESDSQMTNIPGLFAAGECATGLHGANRLGGNSLSDLLVFGKRAGEYAVEYAREAGPAKVSEEQVDEAARQALAPFDRVDTGEGPFQIQEALQDMMQEHAGIIRNHVDLNHALEALSELRERTAKVKVHGNREWNSGWHTAMDLEALLTVSEAIARAARERTESRGAHSRDDYRKKDPKWGKVNLIIEKGADGAMVIRKETIPPLPADLASIIKEQG